VSAPELVIVGRLRRAHGIRGDLVVDPITDAPADVFSAGRRLFAGDVDGRPLPGPRSLTVARARPQPDGSVIVAFEEIADRTAAEPWRDRYVLAPAHELAPPAEGEVYLHELPGMRIVLEDGTDIGEVTEVYEMPHALMLDIRHAGGSALLPFIDQFVRAVDRAARSIIVDPPAGWLD
jgi:16S rRNA processing protein RimM